MNKILILLLVLVGLSTTVMAQDYKANYWASWASVSTQITWTFPSKSREITIFNGSATNGLCVAFNGAVITNGCTSPGGSASATYGDQRVFQIPAANSILLQDFITPSITMQSATGTAASPVSVTVMY